MKLSHSSDIQKYVLIHREGLNGYKEADKPFRSPGIDMIDHT